MRVPSSLEPTFTPEVEGVEVSDPVLHNAMEERLSWTRGMKRFLNAVLPDW